MDLVNQEVNQKKFFIPSRKWWIILQCIMIFTLFIVGLVRGGDINILPDRIAEALVSLFFVIIGYPWGINSLFQSGNFNINNFYPWPILLVGSIVYYTIFFIIINYIYKYKKSVKLLALALFLIMLLNFAGCVRIIEIPLIIT